MPTFTMDLFADAVCVLSRQGTVVFWNVPKEEQSAFRKSLRPYESESYDHNMVEQESETVDYVYTKYVIKYLCHCSNLEGYNKVWFRVLFFLKHNFVSDKGVTSMHLIQ